MATDTRSLDTIDLSDLDHFQQGPPWGVFARLRDEAPVHWNERTGGEPGFWNVTRFDDIRAISRDETTFSSAKGGVFMQDDGAVPLDMLRVVILGMDPPQHSKVRGLVQKVFSPKMVAGREENVREVVNRLIDDVIEQGECDFVDALSVELSLTVIAEMLGVPHDDRRKLFDWTNQISHAAAVNDPQQGMEAIGKVGEYMGGMVGERRQSPGDDLVSAMVNAEEGGEGLSDEEVIPFFALLMFAGNDTTRNTASGAMRALIEHPDERQKLIDDPSLMPEAVEELLRWHSAVQHFGRTATEDTEVAGQPIAEGERVVVWYPSGNRDERAIDDPERFDVSRERVAHQAFGGGGKHFCLGNQLARLELRVLFEAVLQRMPEAEMAGEVTYLPSTFSHEITALPISFPAGRREG